MPRQRRIVHDKGREATASIAGYVYQIWQSVYAWIHLKDEERLVLEAAEDFDIYESEAQVQTVQVKQTGKRVSLRSHSVVEAINNYWEHRQKNPSYRITLRLLTNAERGPERNNPFGIGIFGLNLWERGSTPADIDRLRKFLHGLKLSASLKKFLQVATTDEVTAQLLRRIQWDTGAKSTTSIRRAIMSTIAVHSARYGILASEANTVANALVMQVVDKLHDKERTLTFEDYLRVLEEQATIKVPRSYLMQLQAVAVGAVKPSPLALLRGNFPLPPHTWHRPVFVERLQEILEQEHVLFLQGGTGMGKSVLAALVCHKADSVFWARFRGISPEQVGAAVLYLSEQLEQDNPHILVIDDLDLSTPHRYTDEVKVLLYQLQFSHSRLIITSQGAGSKSLLMNWGLNSRCQIKVPYFSEDDITSLLCLHDVPQGSAPVWSRLIRASTSGHPQLVAARIAILRAYQWQNTARQHAVSSDAIKDTKIEIRKRLMADVPTDQARTLAYRLSLLTFPFKRDIGLALASFRPEIQNPGDAFDILVGPWIEVLENGTYRVSPLLENTALDVWPSYTVQALQAFAARNLGRQKQLTPLEAAQGLILALSSKNRDVLWSWGAALLRTPPHEVPLIAPGVRCQGARTQCKTRLSHNDSDVVRPYRVRPNTPTRRNQCIVRTCSGPTEARRARSSSADTAVAAAAVSVSTCGAAEGGRSKRIERQREHRCRAYLCLSKTNDIPAMTYAVPAATFGGASCRITAISESDWLWHPSVLSFRYTD